MLNLESLFATQAPPSTVPNCAHETNVSTASTKGRPGGTGRAGVPAKAEPTNQAESPEPWCFEPDSRGSEGGKIGHSGHNGNTPVLGEVCPRKQLQHKEFDGLGTVGTLGTVGFQGGEGQKDGGAPGEGAASEVFALHPAAVILALAYCRKVEASNDERISTMLHLESMPPAEQVRRWHSSCIDVGIKPWEVLMLPAPSSGLDCTMCSHLTTRQMASDHGRRLFHWACGLGYLILETGRGTERIWIAPPECQSYVRWQPSREPLAPVSYRSDWLANARPKGC